MSFTSWSQPRRCTVITTLFIALGMSSTIHAKTDDDARSALRAEATALRLQGPTSLDTLLTKHAPLIQTVMSKGVDSLDADIRMQWERARTLIDAVAKQRDAWSSGLFWYDDLEQAKAAARNQNRPILSLRMLGRLSDERSCANSRLFRSVLYTNSALSQLLRERFILHWSTEREVPQITIDFGDGRKIHSTITGNSVHYILDADGIPIDALPGLYSPKGFTDNLERALSLYAKLPQAPTARMEAIRAFHREAGERLDKEFHTLVTSLGLGQVARKTLGAPTRLTAPAAEALPIAVAKAVIEAPMLPTLNPVALTLPNGLGLSDKDWAAIADAGLGSARVDTVSRRFIRYKSGSQLSAMAQRVRLSPKRALTRRIRTLERLLAEDTARNEFINHRAIHRLFEASQRPFQLWEELNPMIYTELFATPREDAWLGLRNLETYPALDEEGVSATPK